jgi:hypothetical protein
MILNYMLTNISLIYSTLSLKTTIFWIVMLCISTVGIVTSYGLDDRGVGFRVPVK